MLNFTTVSEAYQALLAILIDQPEFQCRPRNQLCHELMNCLFTVQNPSDGPIITKSAVRNETMSCYLAVEKELYLSGELRAEVWAEKASKFWLKLANPDGTINSNYGWLAFKNRSLPFDMTPWDWAKESLLRDRDTRQAYVRLALPEHQWSENKDQVCTMHVMFLIRDGRLHATTVMRSNDIVRGLAYDMPWFCYMLIQMADEIKITVGTYSHFAHSLHLYDRDRLLAKEMLGRQ